MVDVHIDTSEKFTLQNFYSWIYLENSIDVQLQQRIISVVNSDDGGPTFWPVMQRSLRGAATRNMIKAQKIINDTKLTGIPELDVGKFHEIVKPALYACNEQGKLPLDV